MNNPNSQYELSKLDSIIRNFTNELEKEKKKKEE